MSVLSHVSVDLLYTQIRSDFVFLSLFVTKTFLGGRRLEMVSTGIKLVSKLR
jgi:hypothetical protein